MNRKTIKKKKKRIKMIHYLAYSLEFIIIY